MRLAVPTLALEERRDGVGQPRLHIDDGAVLVERQRLDLASEHHGRCHRVSLLGVTRPGCDAARATSALTRVHSPSKTGVNALNDAPSEAVQADPGRPRSERPRVKTDQRAIAPYPWITPPPPARLPPPARP